MDILIVEDDDKLGKYLRKGGLQQYRGAGDTNRPLNV